MTITWTLKLSQVDNPWLPDDLYVKHMTDVPEGVPWEEVRRIVEQESSFGGGLLVGAIKDYLVESEE